MYDGSLESSREAVKDGVFANSVSATIPTWRTLKPEIDGNMGNTSSYRQYFNGYLHIFHHSRVAEVTVDIARHGRLPYIDMAHSKPEVVCKSGTRRAIDAIPKATPTFSTTANSPKSLRTSSGNSYNLISTLRTVNRK
jgi:hypothetical protein